jgi:hypothetical protein
MQSRKTLNTADACGSASYLGYNRWRFDSKQRSLHTIC